MVNRILVAALIALSLPSASNATCTYTGDQDEDDDGAGPNVPDKNDEIVLRRSTTSGTTQYKITWCDPDTDTWTDVASCSSSGSGSSAGTLTESVVIYAGADADRVVIISGESYTSLKGCDSISGYSFVNPSCDPICPDVTIAIHGGTWNDHISAMRDEFADPIGYPVAYFGGSGNDYINDLYTSAAGNVLHGNSGNDNVVHQGEHWDTDIYGDSPCGGGVCEASGADCVKALEDFNLLDCGGQTDNYEEYGSGTVSNCESTASCSWGHTILVNGGSE